MNGAIRNGQTRGSCPQGQNCHNNGSCVVAKLCDLKGSAGDGIQRGSCQERMVCNQDGSCSEQKRNFDRI